MGIRPVGERPIFDVVRENIEKYRKEAEMTAAEMCKRAEFNESNYSNFKNGFATMPLKTVQNIAYALGVKTIDLIEDWS